MDFTKVKTSLEKKGYVVKVFETSGEASAYLNDQIDKKTVGIGGSCTVEEMGLYDSLSAHNTVYWHWKEPKENRKEVTKNAHNADVYLSSVNGLSEDGLLINIDGNGNRVAATQSGHETVYFIVGKNKIAPDYEAALDRARNIAGPLNAQRLKRNTPCAIKADHCYDCKSPERICSILAVFWQRPSGSKYEVILINEDLGY